MTKSEASKILQLMYSEDYYKVRSSIIKDFPDYKKEFANVCSRRTKWQLYKAFSVY